MRILAAMFLSVAFAAGTLTASPPSPARWITTAESGADEPNTWIAYRQDIRLDKVPAEAGVRLAADTKYWLWVNGELAVFEGGLKRGPNPRDTYYDEVDLTPYLVAGENRIAVLLWYFGKDGFSHNDSGRAGMIFDIGGELSPFSSGTSWRCRIHPAFGDTGEPHPNFRLAESNILFDARKDIDGWQTADMGSLEGFAPAREIGSWGDAPWNGLVKRPIPQWKDFGIKEAAFERKTAGQGMDSIIVRLPYNMQMTPVITLDDPAGGNLVKISTDHSFAGSNHNVRAEYITRPGVQEYESPGWMNGQKIILVLSEQVSVGRVAYRETGYDTWPEGTFSCDSDFYTRFREKALRTLYVNMRDTFFDCPDRERAQWWGDVVVLMGQSFYTYSTSAHALMRKAILELADWQMPDGALFSPIPAGNWDTELPGQMLAAIGRYGFWNYYMNTGDRETIEAVYPAVKRYLSLWQLDDTGLTAYRQGGWSWGDWGENRDMRLIFAGWHYIALEAAADMAEMLGYPDDAALYRSVMARVKEGYNKCWNGFAYRHPEYHGETDDRVQALAVLAGIAPQESYGAVYEVLKTQHHASPYMEKYVMEALFKMGYSRYAMERTEARFAGMVNDERYTTLFEGWDMGGRAYGGGTSNHAWSGGAVTVISAHVCGVKPLEPGYTVFGVMPEPATFGYASISLPTVRGTIATSFTDGETVFTLNVTVPAGTVAIVTLPEGDGQVTVDGKRHTGRRIEDKYKIEGRTQLELGAGEYVIVQQK